MLVVVETLNRLAAAAGPMALAILWQSAVWAAMVALLTSRAPPDCPHRALLALANRGDQVVVDAVLDEQPERRLAHPADGASRGRDPHIESPCPIQSNHIGIERRDWRDRITRPSPSRHARMEPLDDTRCSTQRSNPVVSCLCNQRRDLCLHSVGMTGFEPATSTSRT